MSQCKDHRILFMSGMFEEKQGGSCGWKNVNKLKNSEDIRSVGIK